MLFELYKHNAAKLNVLSSTRSDCPWQSPHLYGFLGRGHLLGLLPASVIMTHNLKKFSLYDDMFHYPVCFYLPDFVKCVQVPFTIRKKNSMNR